MLENKMNGEDLKTSMSLSLDFKDDQTIEVRAIDYDTNSINQVSFVEMKGAIAHNVVMKTLTEFAKRLANTNGIPARFEDV